RTSVIEQHDVQLFRSFIALLLLNTGDKRLVSAQPLTRSRTNQEFEKDVEIRETRNDFLDTHHSDMHAWQTRRQTNVAFVFDDDDRARFGNAEVDSADADVRGCEVVAQSQTRRARHLRNVV